MHDENARDFYSVLNRNPDMSAYLCFSDYSFSSIMQPDKQLQSQLSDFFHARFFTASNSCSISTSNIPSYLHLTDATDAVAHSTRFAAAEFPNDENESRDFPRVHDKGKKEFQYYCL